MAVKSLAVKYRPTTFDDVVEQDAVKIILKQQLQTGTFKNAYLFCGGAGTGKTTCARIFAQELNQHKGNPIEMDAASNNSVDDIRNIAQQAKTKSLESEYKVFILDECHSLSNTAWQAMLKLIEEPPAKSIFIFCTTDPQKIPKTILSRVQRYDFRRISTSGIVTRLWNILDLEGYNDGSYVVDKEPLEYIAKLADGHMRDAITMLDKCLSYSDDLSIENVVKALGTADYKTFISLTNSIFSGNCKGVIHVIENVYSAGTDIKQFLKQYLNFILDLCKYSSCKSFNFLQVPQINSVQDSFNEWLDEDNKYMELLDTLIKLNAEIKWDTNPKALIEAALLLFCSR